MRRPTAAGRSKRTEGKTVVIRRSPGLGQELGRNKIVRRTVGSHMTSGLVLEPGPNKRTVAKIVETHRNLELLQAQMQSRKTAVKTAENRRSPGLVLMLMLGQNKRIEVKTGVSHKSPGLVLEQELSMMIEEKTAEIHRNPGQEQELVRNTMTGAYSGESHMSPGSWRKLLSRRAVVRELELELERSKKTEVMTGEIRMNPEMALKQELSRRRKSTVVLTVESCRSLARELVLGKSRTTAEWPEVIHTSPGKGKVLVQSRKTVMRSLRTPSRKTGELPGVTRRSLGMVPALEQSKMKKKTVAMTAGNHTNLARVRKGQNRKRMRLTGRTEEIRRSPVQEQELSTKRRMKMVMGMMTVVPPAAIRKSLAREQEPNRKAAAPVPKSKMTVELPVGNRKNLGQELERNKRTKMTKMTPRRKAKRGLRSCRRMRTRGKPEASRMNLATRKRRVLSRKKKMTRGRNRMKSAGPR